MPQAESGTAAVNIDAAVDVELDLDSHEDFEYLIEVAEEFLNSPADDEAEIQGIQESATKSNGRDAAHNSDARPAEAATPDSRLGLEDTSCSSSETSQADSIQTPGDLGEFAAVHIYNAVWLKIIIIAISHDK